MLHCILIYIKSIKYYLYEQIELIACIIITKIKETVFKINLQTNKYFPKTPQDSHTDIHWMFGMRIYAETVRLASHLNAFVHW